MFMFISVFAVFFAVFAIIFGIAVKTIIRSALAQKDTCKTVNCDALFGPAAMGGSPDHLHSMAHTNATQMHLQAHANAVQMHEQAHFNAANPFM